MLKDLHFSIKTAAVRCASHRARNSVTQTETYFLLTLESGRQRPRGSQCWFLRMPLCGVLMSVSLLGPLVRTLVTHQSRWIRTRTCDLILTHSGSLKTPCSHAATFGELGLQPLNFGEGDTAQCIVVLARNYEIKP